MKQIALALLITSAVPALTYAQFGPPPPPPKQGKAGAQVDLTGTWVSVVAEDYRWRMVTPLKGDAASIPYRPTARKVIEAWDPAKDEAAGLQCKSYGAAAIMRVPGRVRISWQDDMTLKLEADQGQQTRLFHFQGTAPQGAAPSWQGYSTARWESPLPPVGNGIPLGVSARTSSSSKSLEVHTTGLREGYLRKNGVPYSDRTTVTEYYDTFKEPNGDVWFTVTTVVDDPVYLFTPFVTSTDFKKEANDSKFSPTACTAR